MKVLREKSEPRRDSPFRVEPKELDQEISDNALVLLVHRQMRLLAGPHQDLDDLVQTALEQLLSARFEGRSKLSTFTHSVCYRVWMKHLRWSYRFMARIRLSDDGVLPEAIESRTGASFLEERERYERLYAALEEIPVKRRAVVSLHDIGGLEVEEIASIVDAKVNTVRSRLRDGRKKLAELLHQDPYFGKGACEGRPQ